jgi:hypothetical protein
MAGAVPAQRREKMNTNNIPADFSTRKFSHSGPASGGVMYGDYPIYYYGDKDIRALAEMKEGDTITIIRGNGPHKYTRLPDEA